MQGRTCAEWLAYLDALDPADEAWRDPEFTSAISWVMLMFIPRRLGQRLIDAQGGSAP